MTTSGAFEAQNGFYFTGDQALAVLLRRLVYPNRPRLSGTLPLPLPLLPLDLVDMLGFSVSSAAFLIYMRSLF